MPRYKCIIEYDGSHFYGWQKQRDVVSVQETLEHALQKFSPCAHEIYSAGRTDAGVHAIGQVVHFDTIKSWSSKEIIGAFNYHLRPAPIVIIQANLVDDAFHARFSAKMRHYQYRILNRRAPLVLDRHRAWQIPVLLDEGLMRQAAQFLIGKHDFSSFRASECQARTAEKTIQNITIDRIDEAININIAAPSFLHHMVRNIVGTLVMIGSGKKPPHHMKSVLKACQRSQAGMTAPPYGLYFMQVDY